MTKLNDEIQSSGFTPKAIQELENSASDVNEKWAQEKLSPSKDWPN